MYKKLKIAFLLNCFPRLSETFILDQITGLIDLGHDVKIYAEYFHDIKYIHKDVSKYYLLSKTVYFFSKNEKKNLFIRFLKGAYILFKIFFLNPEIAFNCINFFKFGFEALSLHLLYFIRTFLNKNYDIIICHFGRNGKLGCVLKKLGKKAKIITFFHGKDLSASIKNNKNIYNDLFKYGDLFLPISEHWKKKLIELGCPEDKIFVHHMGIKIEYFKPVLKKAESIKYILTVGRLVEKKGQEFVIRALPEVIKQYPNLQYVIIGSGKKKKYLERIVENLNLEKYVKFEPAKLRQEIINYYKKADIFILPSVTAKNGDKEGIPIVLMEALAMKIPVISTFHSGIPELIIDGKNGYLINERDITMLSEKILLLLINPGIADVFKRNGYNHIKKEFNNKNQIIKLNKILNKLV